MNPKLTLIDIFSYSCMNCLRSLRFIKKIDRKYKKYGLKTVLVHPPEWEFEKESKNILSFLKKNNIKIPLVIDKNKKIIKKFNIDFWPTQIIVGDGKILYNHIGEGSYKKLENTIRNILKAEPKRIFNREPEYSKFPPLYMGKRKNGKVIDSKGKLRFGIIYKDGKWVQKGEYLTSIGKENSLDILTKGKIISVVAESLAKNSIKIGIKLDSHHLGYLMINKPDLYKITDLKDGKPHKLTITTNKGLAVYSFTFE